MTANLPGHLKIWNNFRWRALRPARLSHPLTNVPHMELPSGQYACQWCARHFDRRCPNGRSPSIAPVRAVNAPTKPGAVAHSSPTIPAQHSTLPALPPTTKPARAENFSTPSAPPVTPRRTASGPHCAALGPIPYGPTTPGPPAPTPPAPRAMASPPAILRPVLSTRPMTSPSSLPSPARPAPICPTFLFR